MKFLFRIVFVFSCFLVFSPGCSKKTTPGKVGKVVRETDPEPAHTNSPLQIKYAKLLEVPADSIKNEKLYSFIQEWYGVRYLMGGTDKKGIDCSAFLQKIFESVYKINVPRTSVYQLYDKGINKFRNKSFLREGDLVFFKINNDSPEFTDHVGLYLQNNRFVNASSSNGVVIYSLNDHYWKKAFVACGRIKK